jgi:hypothetical protein
LQAVALTASLPFATFCRFFGCRCVLLVLFVLFVSLASFALSPDRSAIAARLSHLLLRLFLLLLTPNL